LRHKLMLGLALVVGSVGLLLAGTWYGIESYRTTVRTTERKLEELQLVNILIETLKGPTRSGGADPTTDEYRVLREQGQEARMQLGHYRKVHAETVDRGLDPDGGTMEAGLLTQLEVSLAQFEAAVEAAWRGTQVEIQGEGSAHKAAVRAAYEDTRKLVESLRQALIDDVAKGIRASNSSIRQSVWIVGGAAAWAVVFVLAMLYYFRRWIFAPIRALQAGVLRVHGGDFAQPIRLESRDELQELADEFNAMAARVSATVADLARQVNERSRQLVRSERMVSVGFLAAGVAHEINNPLASILFCAEALERRLQEVLAAVAGRGAAPADAEVLARYLKMIQQEALRCKDITQKLLDFSRTGERKREPADLAGLVRGVLEVARHLPNCRGKHIAFDPDVYVVAPVNAQDLKSVILNLVVNALDSMDDGGTLSIRLAANEAFAEMAFTDTGCGMTPDVLQNIFEPFFTRSRTGKGTGLGLFISHQIIDQHGGTVEASSAGPGLGSTFTVRVPLREIDRGQLPVGGPPADDPAPLTTDPADGTVLPFPGRKTAA
jgi:signal transduction histidine kinase